jgi:hypothetical protein
VTEPGDGAAGSGSGAGAAAPGSAPPAPRSLAQRKADTVAKLGTPAIDVWVASASGSDPHLVPLSLAWLDDRVVVAASESPLRGLLAPL